MNQRNWAPGFVTLLFGFRQHAYILCRLFSKPVTGFFKRYKLDLSGKQIYFKTKQVTVHIEAGKITGL